MILMLSAAERHIFQAGLGQPHQLDVSLVKFGVRHQHAQATHRERSVVEQVGEGVRPLYVKLAILMLAEVPPAVMEVA